MPSSKASTLILLLLAMLFIVVLCGIYYPLLSAPNFLLNFDDEQLVLPLQNIQTLSDYLAAKHELKIVDQAPLRDLSFWLDIQGGINFHGHNFALWILILLVFYAILRQLQISPFYALAATSLFGLHPASADSVAWISARKHLLSFLFILLATLTWLKVLARPGQDRSCANHQHPHLTLHFPLCLTLFFYLCANLTWPINLLWPLLAITLGLTYPLHASFHVKKLFTSPKLRSFWILSGICFVLLAGINFYYYNVTFLQQTQGNTKFVMELAGLGMIFLAIGRHLGQIFFPWLAVPTPLSISLSSAAAAGLILPLLFWGIRKLAVAQKLLITVWTGINLILVCTATTNIFASDTYLLLPLSGFMLALAWAMQEILKRRSLYLLLCLLPLYAVGLQSEVNAWQSETSLWAKAIQQDDHPHIVFSYGQKILENFPQQAYPLLQKFFTKYELPMGQKQRLLAKAIHQAADFDQATKFNLLDQQGVWGQYFRGGLWAAEQQWENAYQVWAKILTDPQALTELQEFPADLAIMAAEGAYFCLKSGRPEKFCQHQVQYLQTEIFRKNHILWPQEQFAARAAVLVLPFTP